MVIGKDIVQMRLKDKSLKIVEYSRFFFEYATGFAMETWRRKTKNKEIPVDLTRPDTNVANKPTADQLEELTLETLAFLAEKFKDDDPQYSLLRMASKGYDQFTRTSITRDERPKKPMTQDEARVSLRDVFKRTFEDASPEEIEEMVEKAMQRKAKEAPAPVEEEEVEEVPTDEA